jgi:putative Mg2+ transporter-C (MgtC) family protein
MIDWRETLALAISLTAAFVLAAVIGAERQRCQRSARLRTNVFVAIGATAHWKIAARDVCQLVGQVR